MQGLKDHFEAAGGIVVSPDERVLLVTNQVGTITFPKGTVEESESYEETAIREVSEESGLKNVRLIRELGLISRSGFKTENGNTRPVTKAIRMFLFCTDEVDLNPVVEDVIKAEWVNPDEVENVLSWQEEADFFHQNRNNLNIEHE